MTDKKYDAKTLKNLRLMLDLGIITKDSSPEAAALAWGHLCTDPVVMERERNDPEPKQWSTRFEYALGPHTHYLIREHIIYKFVAEEMSDEDRAALRARLLARRVKQIQPATSAPAEPLII